MVVKTIPECSFEACQREAIAHSLCMGHYQQRRGGRELTPLRPYRLIGDVEKDGKRLCNRCNLWKPVNAFYRVRRNGPSRSECSRCTSERAKERKNA